jgi:hypothetical protein
LNILEDAYLNSYLRVLNDKWQSFVKEYSVSLTNHQRSFYKSKISSINSKNQKVFVIISDALRFECAKELSKLISYENTENRSFLVKENYMISSLPSYTQLGMASLLPNKEIEIKSTDDTVYVDGKSSKGKDARTKILQSVDVNSIALNDEEFLTLNRESGRELVKSNNIIYIYHNQIDAMGDDVITEEKVFDAVESSFNTITKIVKQIANLSGTNIFITADHGFIYTNTPFLVYEVNISGKVGEFDVELVEEFFHALSGNAGITLHLIQDRGRNKHHIIEATFKAFAVALRRALVKNEKLGIPSTKGVL